VLGFSAIADSPIADIREDQYLLLTSQSLSLSLSSAAVSTAASIALSSQSLVTTLNSLTVNAAANYALQSQNLALTLNNPAISAAANPPALDSQSLALTLTDAIVVVQPPTFDSQSLTLSLNSVSLSVGTALTPDSQTLTSTLNSVEISNGHTIELGSQSLTSTLNSATASISVGVTPTGLVLTTYSNTLLWSTGVTLPLSSLSIASTLNSLRKFWVDIATVQIPEIPYDDCSIASTPICYTPPEPTTQTSVQGNWNEITLNAVVDGQDCAIGSQPICVGVNYTNTELLVTAVDLSGTITGISLKHTSLYDETPANPVSTVASGSGLNATFTIEYSQNVAISVAIVDGGTGYVVGDTLFVLGGIGYNLPSTGKYPAALWTNITTTQTSNWVNIQT